MIGIIGRTYLPRLISHLNEPLIYDAEGNAIREELDVAARVQLQTLFIEMQEDELDLVVGLRNFRMQRPQVRIVIVAPGRAPGDKTLQQIVALGIYDIVAPEEGEDDERILSLLLKALERPAQFSDAARWGVSFDAPATQDRKSSKKQAKEQTVQIQTEVVIQERIIGTPVICLTSANRGSGCTYASLQLALYLQSLKKRVLMVELREKPISVLNPTTDMQEGEVFKVSGIEQIDLTVAKKLTNVKQLHEYDCIVIDIGYWRDRTPEAQEEWERAALSLVTVSSAIWSCVEFVEMYHTFGDKQWSVLLQHPSAGQEKNMMGELAAVDRRECFVVPYQPEPFLVSEESELVWKQVMHSLFPTKEGRKKKGWLPRVMNWFSQR